MIFSDMSKFCFTFVLCTDTHACFSIILGDDKYAEGLKAYLLSRDHSNLKSEFHSSNGKVGLASNLVLHGPYAQMLMGPVPTLSMNFGFLYIIKNRLIFM